MSMVGAKWSKVMAFMKRGPSNWRSGRSVRKTVFFMEENRG
jgi:hypothetical protein